MSRSKLTPVVRLATAAVTAALVVCSTALPAQADQWSDERDRQNAQAAAARSDVMTLQGQRSQAQGAAASLTEEVHESSAAVSAAVARLAASRDALAAAQGQLAIAQQNLLGAERKDAESAARLLQNEVALASAQSLVTSNQSALAAEQQKVGQLARQQYQQNSSLVGIATLVTPTSTGDVNNKLQWATTMFDTTSAQVTRLEDRQAELADAKNAQAVLEARAAFERATAAKNLTSTRDARERAAAAEAAVQQAVAANQAAQAAAESALAEDQAALAAKQAEIAAVNDRIARRLQDQKAAEGAAATAEAARVRAAEAEAARQQAAAAAAAAKQKAANKAAAPAPAPAQPQTQAQGQAAPAASSSARFISPVPAPITSPYGQRLHPVLHVWKLHDGTDFGAGCGTPIRAAASGTVTEEYFNAGYGNRIFIDHGNMGGTYFTTAYNHLSGYAVSVGQRVTQGQVIGYVGTTGYSTGCHLHLMLWTNGTMVNPMNYF